MNFGAGGDPTRDTYDAVVIGSGIAGLTTGALLSRAGMQTLVVERGATPGGYAQAFQRGPYRFDPAIHATWQYEDGQLYDSILRHLGVRDRLTFLPVPDAWSVVFPGFEISLPCGLEAFTAALCDAFPHEEDALRRFLAVGAQVHYEAHIQPPRVAMRDLDQTVEQFPTLFRYARATLGEALDEFLTDARLKAILGAPWPYFALPPSTGAFLSWAQIVFGALIPGSCYCQGSFQKLVDALVAALAAHGGELVLGRQVSRVRIEDDRATGIVLDDGRPIRASIVVSNADAHTTFDKLVGADELPDAFLKRFRRLRQSLSAFVLYGATPVDLRERGARNEMFYYEHWDHDRTYQDIMEGRPGGIWIAVPTVMDPSLAPPGEHLVIFTSLAPYEIDVPWPEAKERYTKSMLDDLEELYPGLRERFSVVETATPLTFESITLNHRGAIYGWEFTPQQAGSRRLSHQSPIPGLYVTGHWTQPGAGSIRVFTSGCIVAQRILRDAGMEAAASTFQVADLPPS